MVKKTHTNKIKFGKAMELQKADIKKLIEKKLLHIPNCCEIPNKLIV